MSDKIKVTICSGTTCYVMGGAQLMMLEDMLPPDLKERVEIVGSPCLEACKGKAGQKPPFVKVNNHLIGEASIPALIEYLRTL
jgi:NADH:ubiquinone oxidoreductase subunit E